MGYLDFCRILKRIKRVCSLLFKKKKGWKRLKIFHKCQTVTDVLADIADSERSFKLIVLSFNYAAEHRMLHGNLTFDGGTCDKSAGVAPILASFPRMKTALKIWHFGFEENDIHSASFNHIYQAINSACCWWYNYSAEFMNESDQTFFCFHSSGKTRC